MYVVIITQMGHIHPLTAIGPFKSLVDAHEWCIDSPLKGPDNIFKIVELEAPA